MNKNIKQTLLSAALIIAGFLAVFALSGYLEKNRSELPEKYADEDLNLQGAKLKKFSLGFEGLLADWYWMNSLQYLGDKIIHSQRSFSIDNLNSLNPRLLYPYLNNATDLDPNFISVYEFGATVLPAIDKDKAIKLTQKGIDNNPNNWRLYHYLGYIYWRFENYDKASEVYEKGSQTADAPDFMRLMAARMKSEGSNREVARVMYQQMVDEAQDEQSKESARLRLLQINSMDERQTIQKILDDFKSKNNRCVETLRETLPLLRTVKLPDNQDFHIDNSNNLLDPTDTPYILDTEKCVIKLDAMRTKIPSN